MLGIPSSSTTKTRAAEIMCLLTPADANPTGLWTPERCDLELAHDSQRGLAGAQQQVAIGDTLGNLQLLIHNPEEVDGPGGPQLASLINLGLPFQIRLHSKEQTKGPTTSTALHSSKLYLPCNR